MRFMYAEDAAITPALPAMKHFEITSLMKSLDSIVEGEQAILVSLSLSLALIVVFLLGIWICPVLLNWR